MHLDDLWWLHCSENQLDVDWKGKTCGDCVLQLSAVFPAEDCLYYIFTGKDASSEYLDPCALPLPYQELLLNEPMVPLKFDPRIGFQVVTPANWEAYTSIYLSPNNAIQSLSSAQESIISEEVTLSQRDGEVSSLNSEAVSISEGSEGEDLGSKEEDLLECPDEDVDKFNDCQH